MELNSNQQKAANTLDGNLLIIASAGTGKTTTIIERYFNLISERNLDPHEIMMTTFTNKAAADMVNKIRKRTDKISPYIGTMHSLFLRMLREHSGIVSGGRDFLLLTDTKDKNKIIKGILEGEEIENTANAVKYFSSWISKYKNLGIFSDSLSLDGGIDELKQTGRITEVLDDEIVTVNPLWRKKVNLIYSKYQDYLTANHLLDFDEILLKTFKLFEEFPDIRHSYRNNFKSIMVDEAQDLNIIQKKILDQLSTDNVCFIGDDCQNIYEWRGSSNEIIFDFSENKEKIFLEHSYRSTDEIIEAVNSTIDEMKHKIDKKLVPTIGSGEKVYVDQYFQATEEKEDVISLIEDLLSKGENPEEIAILYRTNLIGKIFEKALIMNGIPCHISKNIGFFDREEIKDTLSLLRLKVSRESFFDFERISKIIPGFGKVSLKKMKSYATEHSLSFSELISDLHLVGISEDIVALIRKLISSLEHNDINQILIESGYRDYVLSKYSDEPSKLEDKQDNIDTLIVMYKDNADSLLSFLDSLHESDKKEKSEGKVILSTIHSAKGLEWKHVFLVSCNEKILPFYRGELSPLKRDSELRLFYVAISRAKKGLYISSHMVNGFSRYVPSHFLSILQKY